MGGHILGAGHHSLHRSWLPPTLHWVTGSASARNCQTWGKDPLPLKKWAKWAFLGPMLANYTWKYGSDRFKMCQMAQRARLAEALHWLHGQASQQVLDRRQSNRCFTEWQTCRQESGHDCPSSWVKKKVFSAQVNCSASGVNINWLFVTHFVMDEDTMKQKHTARQNGTAPAQGTAENLLKCWPKNNLNSSN